MNDYQLREPLPYFQTYVQNDCPRMMISLGRGIGLVPNIDRPVLPAANERRPISRKHKGLDSTQMQLEGLSQAHTTSLPNFDGTVVQPGDEECTVRRERQGLHGGLLLVKSTLVLKEDSFCFGVHVPKAEDVVVSGCCGEPTCPGDVHCNER